MSTHDRFILECAPYLASGHISITVFILTSYFKPQENCVHISFLLASGPALRYFVISRISCLHTRQSGTPTPLETCPCAFTSPPLPWETTLFFFLLSLSLSLSLSLCIVLVVPRLPSSETMAAQISRPRGRRDSGGIKVVPFPTQQLFILGMFSRGQPMAEVHSSRTRHLSEWPSKAPLQARATLLSADS